MQDFESSIYFRCPECGSSDKITVAVPEFDWSAERMSDMQSEGSVDILCPSCEYEFEAHVVCDSGGCQFTLVGRNAETFYGDPPFYGPDDEEWINPPDEPHQIFLNTISGMRNILKMELVDAGDPEILNRMVFSQAVTTLESYLSDNFKLEILNNKTAQIDLAEADMALKNEKIALSEILRSADIAQDRIKAYVASIVWHNLPRVRVAYKIVFSIDIEKCTKEWGYLQKMISLRHDCVHRNGRDHEGNYNNNYSRDFVSKFLDEITAFVEAIEVEIFTRAPKAIPVPGDDWKDVLF